ncbi:DUF2971 domain-containing protein [Anaerovorax odorimutans]|uniref:DUF2971 domain-containing protein n=1 Tax=Anaerovorax odorimutans TaxID=109327 RepID=UPI00041FA285|nr:DUF2971 domain-containing protein [Anaerovorax odorimutans]
MEIEWFKRFVDLYFNGDYKCAYQLKYNNIPSKLYKFQPFEENRVSMVLNNKLWFSLPKDMNDPFDSRGVYWDFQEIEDFLKSYLSEEKIKQYDSINDIVNGSISSMRDNIKITCFSEELYSMPMWAHYAKNHTGFCVEYDFTILDYDNTLVKGLFPVGYETKRYNITNLFKMAFSSKYDMRIKLLFFLMNLKHSSWSYEKEWRIISTRETDQEPFIAGLDNCPVKPIAIYLGINFDKSKINDVKDKFENINIPIYKLRTSNSKFFDLELHEL